MEGKEAGGMDKVKEIALKMKISNFLSIKKAGLESRNGLTVLVAPNKSGKTHLLLFLYSIFWSLWKWKIEKKSKATEKIADILKSKIKRTFLLNQIDELTSWEAKSYSAEITVDDIVFSFPSFEIKIPDDVKLSFDKSPVYIQPAGMGIYYKGIHSMKKYYPERRLISEAITDFLTDLFIVSDRTEIQEDKELLEYFEELFGMKFYIQQDRIYAKEKKSYIIEKAASGIQTLSWFYLAIKYSLFGNTVFIDEPEAGLHPEYIDRLVALLVELSKKRKVFIATHSDYFLESLNKHILKKDIKVDVWVGKLEEKGAVYTHYQADKENLIDPSPLSSVYIKVLEKRALGMKKYTIH